MPDQADASTLHELRRALLEPIYRVHKGQLGPVHDYAVAQGWFRAAGGRLALTDLGLKILAEDQCRHGLRSSNPDEGGHG